MVFFVENTNAFKKKIDNTGHFYILAVEFNGLVSKRVFSLVDSLAFYKLSFA